MASLARSCRASWATASACASSSLPSASSSAASSSSLRRLTTSPPTLAKAAPKRPAQKKKLTIRKNPSSGPRSKGGKGSGGDANVSSGTLTTAHYKKPADMSHIPTLSPESVADNVNKPLAFSQKALDAFTKFGVEKKVAAQLASYIRPLSIVRKATVSLYDELDASASSAPKKLVLTSAQSTGKSHLLLQSVSYALSSEWLVVYLPRLIHWINSSSLFSYSAEEQAYLQPELVKSALSAVLAVNSASGVLAKIKVTTEDLGAEPIRGVNLPQDASLKDLLQAATANNIAPLASQRLFDAFLSVLARQSEVPTLFAIDDLQALYLPSKYRNPDYELVQSYELAPIRSLIRFLAEDQQSGGKGGVKRGSVLAAVSRSHTEWMPSNELESVLNEQLPRSASQHRTGLAEDKRVDAYTKLDLAHLKHVQSSNWTVFGQTQKGKAAAGGAEQWSVEELKGLYEVRRNESRSWSVPAVSAGAIGADVNAGPSSAMRIAQQAMFAQAQKPTVGTGGATEDELFLMRVIDSGRNPLRFDRALRGTSLM
ncbi:unnamed protein product [Parajaminaea phylloscopi]